MQGSQTETHGDTGIGQLSDKVIDDASRLAKAEIADVRAKLQRRARRSAPSLVAFGIAGLAAVMGLGALSSAAGGMRPRRAMIISGSLFAGAGVAAVTGALLWASPQRRVQQGQQAQQRRRVQQTVQQPEVAEYARPEHPPAL